MRTIRRKIRQESRVVAETGLPQMGPSHYLQYLPQLHEELKPEVYFEIGTESGASLSFSRCVSIAVDPEFKVETAALAGKTEIHLYQQASDDFFASGAMNRLGYAIDLAFLDGMHLFEFLLRDFINTEKRMKRNGVVTMHDCVPFTRIAAERDWDTSRTVSWTGDVWKIIPILRDYRPDLEIEVLSLQPSGLVRVQNLNPDDNVLSDKYDEIVEKYLEVTLDQFGVESFSKLCAPVDPFAAAPPSQSRIIINTSTPDEASKPTWGDHHFGAALSDAIGRQQRNAVVRTRNNWSSKVDPGDVSLLLRGHGALNVQPPSSGSIWLIYPGKPPVSDDELNAARHIFVASIPMADDLAQRFGSDKVSYLPQAFDKDRMYPPQPASQRKDIVFVGNNHFAAGKVRPIVQLAMDCGFNLKIWGKKWHETAAAPLVQAEVLPNEELGDTYRSAEVVLCDHTRPMRNNGFISNRIFDALACGAPVISDHIHGLPEGFAGHVWQVSTKADFAAAITQISSETNDQRDARREFAASLVKTHSFDARVETLLTKLGA